MSINNINFLVNYRNATSGKTALMDAAIANKISIVRNIVSLGADLNLQSSNEGKTALIYAALNSNYNMIRYLLLKGADVNIQDKKGETALSYSIQHYFAENDSGMNNSKISKTKMFEIIKLLINNKADLGLKNKRNQTVASIVRYYKDEKFYEFLKKFYQKNQEDLTEAIHTNNEHLVNIILRHKHKINQINQYGNTPLIEAVLSRNLNMINLLIEKDCEINMPDENGNTALMFAVEMGLSDAILILLKNKANSSKINNDNKYAFLFAIENQDIETLKLLTCKNNSICKCYIDKKAYTCAQKTNNKKLIALMNFDNETYATKNTYSRR
ncbi:MAG: ankyrin repeat domain-containing protein [Bacteroidetes bacterium]|jgi:uncharacterized protein|nr:ankyrin repeat domain-containing protein [Bacteroidota bacterium]MBT6685637.1 ankyrin repeat domain-containing protein [Bacteroidota bacterium]MBT7141861.1 ankyrin repeat domain-containing protein [Bacteroidota bacterium]MBT7491062.1 ankyrin repeat domain-containing protein [Bacteroidota bacterium]